MKIALEQIKTRCLQLGHSVPLSYCLKMNAELPCPSIINCWEEKIPIVEFIEKNYSMEEIKKIFSTDQKSKIEKLIDMVNKYNRC